MKVNLIQQVFWTFPVLLCFLLPVGGAVLSLIIIAWLVFSFFNFQKQFVLKGLKNRQLKILWAFFVFTCLSAFFSNNKSEVFTAIEIKFSFVLFPWLLFCFDYPLQILKRCLVAFVSGNFLACLFLLARATYYASNGHPEYFFYTSFSDFIHASYFSMYLIFAITIIVIFYGKWFNFQKEIKYLSVLFISIFAVCIFLCSSKLGILSFIIAIPVLFIYKYPKYLNVKSLVLLLGGFVLLIFIAFKLFPSSFERLKSIKSLEISSIDKTSKESTTVRVLIWQQAINLIQQKPLFGHGVADANDKLYDAYKVNGLTGALQYHLNAHNQYLQSFIGMGLIGFTILIYLTYWQLLLAIRKRKFLLFIFAFLISLNFLVESMLQTAAGVVFFVFFYCYTQYVDDQKLLDA